MCFFLLINFKLKENNELCCVQVYIVCHLLFGLQPTNKPDIYIYMEIFFFLASRVLNVMSKPP